jgi:hypothetical protein
MKMPWKVKKKIETPDQEKLERLRNLLFPPLVLKEEMAKDGQMIKYHVDYSVDSNLDAVLMDLQEGHNDPACHKTLNTIIKRLNSIRILLDAYAEIDVEARYIIVDDMGEDVDVRAADD